MTPTGGTRYGDPWAQAREAVLTFAAAGTYVISAVSDQMTLVPPVCIVTVTE